MNSMESAVAATTGQSVKRSNIADLLSPPDEVHDNFSLMTAMDGPKRTSKMEESSKRQANAPPSPPISPYAHSGNNMTLSPSQCHATPVRDPILFPQASAQSVATRQPPLFGTGSNQDEKKWAAPGSPASDVVQNHEAAIDQHMLHRRQRLHDFTGHWTATVPLPSRDDYRTCLGFQSSIYAQYAANPQKYLRERKAELAEMAEGRRRRRLQLPSIQPAQSNQSTRNDSKVHGNGTKVATGRVQKPTKAKVERTPREKPVKPRPIRANNGPATSTSQVGDAQEKEPRARVVGATRVDKDYLSIPDYCPPLDSLQHLPRGCMKVDWKGNSLDLSNDPLRDQLHPEELVLASSLRLNCATYLTTKRRIFQGRLQCAKREDKKEFRKTDAQQAGKIDVNKASQLWVAYHQVGWFDPKWLSKYLN